VNDFFNIYRIIYTFPGLFPREHIEFSYTGGMIVPYYDYTSKLCMINPIPNIVLFF